MTKKELLYKKYIQDINKQENTELTGMQISLLPEFISTMSGPDHIKSAGKQLY